MSKRDNRPVPAHLDLTPPPIAQMEGVAQTDDPQLVTDDRGPDFTISMTEQEVISMTAQMNVSTEPG